MDRYTGYSRKKKWQYFTANIKHRQPSITFQNAGSFPVCRLCAIVTPQRFIYFYLNTHKNKRIFQELFAPLPFPPPMNNFCWLPRRVPHPGQIQLGSTARNAAQSRAVPATPVPPSWGDPGQERGAGGAPATCMGKNVQRELWVTLRYSISFQTTMLFKSSLQQL